jgi:hypothetical protein
LPVERAVEREPGQQHCRDLLWPPASQRAR